MILYIYQHMRYRNYILLFDILLETEVDNSMIYFLMFNITWQIIIYELATKHFAA